MEKKYKIFLLIFLVLIILVGALTFVLGSFNKNKAKIITNEGTIVVKLYPQKAPLTVANFKKYVKNNFYDGLIFHRVIKGFMIQGGGLYPNGTVKPTYAPIPSEANNGLSNLRGTIAMARTSDPNSATSQFFINTVDNTFLDHTLVSPGYTVFGKVVRGMNVVDKISNVQTETKYGLKDWPVENITIEKVVIY